MAVTLPIYTITGGELIRAFYDAIAAMFQYAGVMGLFKTAIILGGVWTIGQFIVSRDPRGMFFFILKYAFVIAFILTPKCTVQIHDRTDSLTNLSVDHVPLVLGLAGSLSSQLSNRVTQTFELFFHAPNDMDYSQTGMIMGAKLFLSASQIKITDPAFNGNMQKFMQQCVFYDLMYGRYGLKELNSATDIWGLVKEKASVARGFIYDGSFKSCVEAAGLLDSAWSAVIADAKSKYAGFSFGNQADTLANFDKYLPQTYQHLTHLSAEASTIIRQNMMANAIRDGVFAMGSRLNSKSAIESFSASRAQEKIPAALSNIGLMSAYWLPIIQSAVFCIVIGCFIFVLFFFLFPFGISFFQFYVTLYVWLSLWAPIFTVINYIMTILAQCSLSFASAGAITLAYQTGINQVYEHLAAVGGYLAFSTIGLSYMLISRRVDSLISASQQAGGVINNAATSAAEEVQTGNYSYGNTSFSNHNGFNTNSYHHDQNARVSVGNVETSLEGGSIARVARNGGETLSMASATSHTPLNIQLGESTRAAFSELSDKAMQTSMTQSNASSEQYGASLRSLVELGQTQTHGEQSGDGFSVSNSAGFNTAASKVSNLVDHFAKDHNMSQDEAIKVLTAASVNGGVSIGVGGSYGVAKGGLDIGANIRRERDSSHSTQNAHLINEARRFSEENNFNDVVNQARQATKDSHFRTSDDKSGRLSDSFTTGYDKSIHYRNEAMASITESEGYHRQASVAQEQTASINLDAQTGFIDWLSQHRAPNSHGNIGLQQAEWMIRHDPEMAQAYARQFVGEKTSQSIGQFQHQHALSPNHVRQVHQENQNHISGSNKVDARLSEYNQTLDGHAKTINVGQVSQQAVKNADQEMSQSNKELHARTQTVIEGGEKVMQGVIVTEANQFK